MKSHLKTKLGMAFVWGASKIWGVPFNIYVMAEAGEIKLGIELGFAQSNYKITLKTIVGVAFVWGALKVWGFPRPIAKLHPQEKVRHGRRLRQLLKFRVPL